MAPIKIQFKGDGKTRYEARKVRSFVPRMAEQDLIKSVNACREMSEVEKIAELNNLCDICSLGQLNIDTARLFINVVIKFEYRYPRSRGRISYLGSKAGYVDALCRIQKLDRQAIAKFGLQAMCYDQSYIDLASLGLTLVKGTEYNDKENNILAQAFSLSGLLDAVVLDEQDFRGFGYKRLCSRLKSNAQNGYHPQGCEAPSYVIYHELGHVLDSVCDLSNNQEFIKYYGSLSRNQIERGLSSYATTSAQEFIAEAFAEYMCNASPRQMALNLSGILNKIYKYL